VSPKSLLSATKAFCITQLQLDEAFVNELVTDELIDLIDEDGDGVVSVVGTYSPFGATSCMQCVLVCVRACTRVPELLCVSVCSGVWRHVGAVHHPSSTLL
jgi:hypothetical protein